MVQTFLKIPTIWRILPLLGAKDPISNAQAKGREFGFARLKPSVRPKQNDHRRHLLVAVD
jgi:hypothetical protein